jgi:hypothetical protein
LSNFLFSQDYICKIKIKGIDNVDNSKPIIECIRNKFNVTPIFDDKYDIFEIHSNFNIKKDELDTILVKYSIESYSNYIRVTKDE